MCHWHKCRMATVCHTLCPLSVRSVLAGFVHTPLPGQRRQWSLDWLDWEIQGDWGWNKAKHPRRLDLARVQSWLCHPLYRSPMRPSLTEQTFQGKVVRKFKNRRNYVQGEKSPVSQCATGAVFEENVSGHSMVHEMETNHMNEKSGRRHKKKGWCLGWMATTNWVIPPWHLRTVNDGFVRCLGKEFSRRQSLYRVDSKWE